MEGAARLVGELWGLLTPPTLLHVAWATALGIVVGSLPGLTATMGVALLTTLTYRMPADQAILILICTYVGAIHGGSRSAILLNIPGTPASAATALDGHPMALEGRAGHAMGLATIASAVGTVIGVAGLVAGAPLLAEVALGLSSYEMAWLALFGVVISGRLTAGHAPLKGYVAGILGLLVATIGMEGIHGHVRFSFGVDALGGGVGLIPAMVGAFGFAEVLDVIYERRARLAGGPVDRMLPRPRDLWRLKGTAARSGVVGTLVGIVPGVGEDVGAWASYALARRTSREPHRFGHGSAEGLTAAEAGNAAVVPGALIPALTLAVPGSAAAAVLIAALFVHGVRPGPTLLVQEPDFVHRVAAMLLLATVAMTVIGLATARPLLLALRIPRERLMPVVFVLCVVGSYAISQRMFDVYVMLVFGVVGFGLRRMAYPMAPLVLGIVLGDLLDKNLRRGLLLSEGDVSPFLTRPVSAGLAALTAATLLLSIPWLRGRLAAPRRRPP